MNAENRIVIDQARINNMEAMFERTWSRKPTAEERQGLIDDFVLEEIYYRQALAIGIDKDDPLIRRRLRQKMEFFTSSSSPGLKPDDIELEQYLEANAAKYRTDNRYSFEQLYFSTDRPVTELELLLEKTAQSLNKGDIVEGDRSLLPGSFTNASAFEINRTFGTDFSDQLDNLPTSGWSAPLQSGLGFHFIKLTQHHAGQLPALAQVRDKVLRDWSYDQSLTLKQGLEKKLRDEYQVIVEWPE